MKDWLARVSATRPFTWQAIVCMGLGLFTFGPKVLVSRGGHSLSDWRAVIFATILILAISTYLADFFILKNRKHQEAPIISWILIIGLSVTFPLCFKFVASEIFELETRNFGPIRFFTSSFLWMIGTLVFAIVINETRQFRSDFDRLQGELAEARLIEKREQQDLKLLREKLIIEIKEILHSSFENLNNTSSHKLISSKLQQVVEDVVRPLSNTLKNRDVKISENSHSETLENKQFSDRMKLLAYRLVESNPFEYKLTPIVVAFSSLFMKTWFSPIQNVLLSTVVSILFLSLILFISSNFFEKRLIKIKKLTLVFLTVSFFIFIAILDTLIATIILGYKPYEFSSLILFTEFGVIFLLAVLKVIPTERKKLLSELDETLFRVRWMNSRLGQLNWIEQQRLANVVHGDIQAQIWATSLEISLNPKKGNLLNDQIRDLQQRCELALTTPSQTINLKEFLDSVQKLWAASVIVESFVPQNVLTEVDKDPVALNAFKEITREALNNAVKHARATKVQISAELHDSLPSRSERDFKMLQILITSNNHVGFENKTISTIHPNGKTSGQGSTTYHRLSSAWELEVSRNRTALKAVISIGNGFNPNPW